MTTKNLKKFTLIGSLYVSQYMPAFFLSQSLPVLLRQQGLSLEVIGLLPVVSLPMALKFLWSPVIDRYGFTRWGHYRFWIICFQFLIVGITVICAFLDIQKNLTSLLICMGLLFFAGASQDIATDALAISLLEPQERGLGNAIQGLGNALGGILAGGGFLILLSRWGWRNILLTIALIVVLAMIPIFLYQEKIIEDRAVNITNKQAASYNEKPLIEAGNMLLFPISYFKTFVNFCNLPGMWYWLLFLFLYIASNAMALIMFRPLLVDIGLSLEEIGWLLGIVSICTTMIGGLLAGVFINSLGRKRSLLLFGSFWVVARAAFLLPAFNITSLPILYLVIVVTSITSGLIAITTSTIMMDKSRKETAGSDYTFQNSIVYFAGTIAAAIGGLLARVIGYKGVFTVSMAIALISMILGTKLLLATDIQSIKKISA
ncbi:MFS transporter [Calothrix sp. PCC 7507]|uniref:MFS transporter n=1 Tax=Calothrix sp. PCC 7507 TaxID=99598 RepID=UPI00029F4690|nr:MFS transporter [Calothrix sp. PCC 7507]AFY33186.1 major facilitator superfamily MFS_1 [Calothrix sp. PCC 7507]